MQGDRHLYRPDNNTLTLALGVMMKSLDLSQSSHNPHDPLSKQTDLIYSTKQHVGGPPVVSGNEESHRERSEDTDN